MDFYEILDQVIDLLKQRERVTYRALKRQFNLDDDFIADLKEEMIDAQRVAIEEDGRILIWTGEIGEVTKPSAQPDKPESQSVSEQAQRVQGTSPPAEPNIPDAERRQLTVMFCDLVGSTSLSGELDPEDLREVIRDYQTVCTEVIQHYDGHVAQLLGDGLLVYFGFPSAHEDDAQRAVRTGLGIIETIETLNTRLEQNNSIRLAVRIGIHTGLVVIGEMGGEGRQEQLALGETPNVAARIQGLAEPDTVVIGEATYRLIEGYFDCDVLGEHELRGVSQPIAVYRVQGDSGIQNRLDVVSTRGLTPLVGRSSELQLLTDRWNQAKSGEGQVVLLNAEPGLGKSRMVQALREHLVDETYTRLECRSSPYYQNSALYPVIDLIQRTLGWQQGDAEDEKLHNLEQALSQYRLPVRETVSLIASLLSFTLPEDQYPSLSLTPQRKRQKTLEMIVAIILELAEREPILFILEDLHWTDPSTIELLGLLIEQAPTSRLYALLTCRPEFESTFGNHSYLTQILLNRLSQHDIEQIIHQITDGKPIPGEVLQQIVEKTDGVPLFIEEMTKAVLESGVLKEANGQYELTGSISTLSIPATLQDSLMARLDRLVTAKAVAQYGSVIGRQFSYELLQAVSQLDEAMLQHELGRLVKSELVYQRGLPPHATFTFKHALIQDTAYESLLRTTRQGYHHRIAEVLEERFPETAENQPELLARHYTEAGLNEQAIPYWHKAGKRAAERSADEEAVRHLMKGLDLLEALPDTREHTQYELVLNATLGSSLQFLHGPAAPVAERAFTRARDLCQQLGDTPELFEVVRGLCTISWIRGEHQAARVLGEQLLRLAAQHPDPMVLLVAHCALGGALLLIGEFAAAHEYFEQGIALQVPQHPPTLWSRYGNCPEVRCRGFGAWNLWLLGFPDQALRWSHEACSLAEELHHFATLTFALNSTAIVHQFRREEKMVQARTEAAMAIATEHELGYYVAYGTMMQGAGLAMRGQADEAIKQIRQGLDAYRATGAGATCTYFLTLLAEAYGRVGQTEEGLTVVNEAITEAGETDEWYCGAELYRLKGELLLSQSSTNQPEAETCYHQALNIARRQQAKSWELRAAASLARLWQLQNKRQDAYDLLAPVYGWFTEGFDTADLIDANILLGELSEGQP